MNRVTGLSLLMGLMLLAGCASDQATQEDAVFYVSGDIEGMNGYQGNADRAKNDEILHAHFLATVEGLHDGGADKIWMKSFHGMPGEYPAYVDRNVKSEPVNDDLPSVANGMKGVVLVGFHGVPPSAFGHAYRVGHFFINDQKVGEVTLQVMLAASRGVPTVLYVGNSWGAKEVLALAPDAVIVETRPGNRGNEGDLDPKMMEKVRAGAKKAAELAARGKIAVPKLPAKFVMTVPMKTNGAAELAPKLLRYPVKVEGRNVTRESTDFMEIYSFLHAAFWVQSESDRQEKAKQGN